MLYRQEINTSENIIAVWGVQAIRLITRTKAILFITNGLSKDSALLIPKQRKSSPT